MALISTYTFSVSKTLTRNLCSLCWKGSLRCSCNVRGILFQILTPLIEKDNSSFNNSYFCQLQGKYLVCPSFVGFGWPYCHHPGCYEGCTVLAFVSMGHDTYSAGVLLLCAIHVPFCALATLCMPIATLWCYGSYLCQIVLFDTVILSGYILWFSWGCHYVAVSSVVLWVCSALLFFPSSC